MELDDGSGVGRKAVILSESEGIDVYRCVSGQDGMVGEMTVDVRLQEGKVRQR